MKALTVQPPKDEDVRPSSRPDCVQRWLIALAGVLSIAAFAYFYGRDTILAYSDAVSHLEIARRVIDSRTPGLLQLGTVWLPLPHVLMIPFLVSMRMWRTGAGGS